MNRITKHIIITLCFLISTAQAIHLFCHVLNSDHSDKKEISHLVDNHKCSICENPFLPLSNDNELEEFTWILIDHQSLVSDILVVFFKENTTLNLKLRGPPYLIA